MKIDNDKYYVCPAGWQGMDINDFWERVKDNEEIFECSTVEETLKEIDYQWNWLAPDEGCYVYHNKILYPEEDENWQK